MESKALLSEAIQYQKTASDQVFEMLELYQSSSNALVKQTINNIPWIPEISKESYFTLDDNYQQMTVYLKSLVDAGFEQAKHVFSPPAAEQNPNTASKPKAKTEITASKNTPTTARKRKASPTKAKAASSPKTSPKQETKGRTKQPPREKAATAGNTSLVKTTTQSSSEAKKATPALKKETPVGTSQTKPNPIKKQAAAAPQTEKQSTGSASANNAVKAGS